MSVSNQLAGRDRKRRATTLMRTPVIAAVVLIGLVAFGAMLSLMGYAGDIENRDRGGAHVLSRSGVGYVGIYQLLGDIGLEMRHGDTVSDDSRDGLRVITLDRGVQASDLDELQTWASTLIVMPKWKVTTLTREGQARPGWVQTSRFSPLLPNSMGRDLVERATGYAPDVDVEIDPVGRYALAGVSGLNISNLQTFSDPDTEVWDVIHRIEDERTDIEGAAASNGAVLMRLRDDPIFLLSEPDLLSNHGISTRTRAQLAVGLIETVMAELGETAVIFDTSLHGLNARDNIVKLLTRPPFLAATLCLIAAGILIGWQAFSRFGDPVRDLEAPDLGKRVLADNAARFIAVAGRETDLAPDYARLVRRQVLRVLRLDGQTQQTIDTVLTRQAERRDIDRTLAKVQADLLAASDRESLLRRARELYETHIAYTDDTHANL